MTDTPHPSDEDILQRLTTRLAEIWAEGSCVASPGPSGGGQEKLARAALRRWQSFDRRNKIRRPTLEHRIEDLAKGLRDIHYSDRHMVGQLMGEYRDVAERLADVLQEPSDA